jgi:hypothetical protein
MMVLGIISVLLSLVMLAASSNLSQKAKQAGPVVEQFLADLVGQLFLAGVIWMVVAVGGFLKKVWSLWVGVFFNYIMILVDLNLMSNDNVKDKGFLVLMLLMTIASLVLIHRSFICAKRINASGGTVD